MTVIATIAFDCYRARKELRCIEVESRITGLAARSRSRSVSGTGMPSIRNADHRSECLQYKRFRVSEFRSPGRQDRHRRPQSAHRLPTDSKTAGGGPDLYR